LNASGVGRRSEIGLGERGVNLKPTHWRTVHQQKISTIRDKRGKPKAITLFPANIFIIGDLSLVGRIGTSPCIASVDSSVVRNQETRDFLSL
jgi:hypothetical protein